MTQQNKEIPSKKYQGYIWYSDQKKPEILCGDKDYRLKLIEGENPFVIEALLYCEDDETSIMVKHTGKYIVQEYKLKEEREKCEEVKKQYLPHGVNRKKEEQQADDMSSKVKRLNFSQFWQEEKDSACEDMPVLKLKATVFTGFTFNNTTQNK